MYQNYDRNYQNTAMPGWYPVPKPQTTCLSLLNQPTLKEKREIERARPQQYLHSYESGFRLATPVQQPILQGQYSPPRVQSPTGSSNGWHFVQPTASIPKYNYPHYSTSESEILSDSGDWEMVSTDV